MMLRARRRERELTEARANEARLKSLTALSADWFWETDAEHRITWLSGGGPVATLFGNEPTFGKRFWEIPRVEVDPRALEAHLERLGRELPFFDLEIARADERGARQVHIVSGQSHRTADGRFVGYRGVGRDVTEQRRAERGLAQAKERLELALDGGNLAEWHLDFAADELYAGDGWARFLGDDRSPLLMRGAGLAPLIHPDDLENTRALLVKALKGGDDYDVEFRLRSMGGEWNWLHARGRVTERGPDGRALRMSGVASDIGARKSAEAALRDAERRYRTVADIAPHAILVHCLGRIDYVNQAAAQMLKARSPAELVGRQLYTLFDEQELPRLKARRQMLIDKVPHVTDFEQRRMRCLDGSEIVVEAAGVSYYDNGRVLIQAMFRDVTAEQRVREAIAQSDQRFRDVAAVSGEYVWEADAQWRYTYLSERVESMLGFGRGELLGRSAWEFVPLGEERAIRERLAAHGGEGAPFRDLVHRSMTKAGGGIWLSLSGVPLRDAQGRWAGYRGTAADVTARKQAEARIEQLATRDPLTGLANRSLLGERVGAAVLAAARARAQLALLVVDLDRFKLVNDSLGHQAGDALVRAVAERLANALRREDMLGHIGGDAFVVLWNGLKSREEAASFAERLLAILARPFTVEGATLSVGASIGIALYPRDGRDFAELFKHADAAMHEAKSAGRGGWRFYHPSFGTRAAERLRLENELRGALARSELLLHWQPVVRGRDAIAGAEALVRWRHPVRGVLGPEEFVPLAEDCGLIGPFGEWTLERALSQIGGWQRSLKLREKGQPWFAVNVSAAQLAQGAAFTDRLAAALAANGVEGGRLELEVTERVLVAQSRANLETLKKIGEMGVCLSIDDFGTGYSSLAYLRDLPIHKLKIDRAFLRSIETSKADQAIVRTIASLADALGVDVAAEGVETAAQRDLLLGLGCELWQGHLCSEPLDAEAFARFYEASLARPGRKVI